MNISGNQLTANLAADDHSKAVGRLSMLDLEISKNALGELQTALPTRIEWKTLLQLPQLPLVRGQAQTIFCAEFDTISAAKAILSWYQFGNSELAELTASGTFHPGDDWRSQVTFRPKFRGGYAGNAMLTGPWVDRDATPSGYNESWLKVPSLLHLRGSPRAAYNQHAQNR